MSLITHKKIYYINSHNRTNGTNSHFTTNIVFYPQDKFDRVVLLQATIPKSFYTVRRNLNTFTLTEGLQSSTITIPIGNYSRKSLQDTLQTLLNQSSPNNIIYSINWPNSKQPNTGKYTFTCSNVNNIQPIFTFTDKLFRQLGFNENTSNQFNNYILESTNVINLQSDSVIYIHSDICTNGVDDVLQEIYTSAGNPDFSNIHWENYDVESYSKQLVSGTNTTFTIYLADQDGNEINLNGVNMNLTLMLYKHNDISQLTRGYINYRLEKDNETIIVSKELDYRPLLVSEPEYEFTRLYPQSGTTSTTVANGGNETIFEIPPTKAFNFAKSWFQFQFILPSTAALIGFAYADFTPFFRQIQVYTKGGLNLMDHSNYNLHSKMVTKIKKSIVETMNSYNTAQYTSLQSYTPCYSSNNLPGVNGAAPTFNKRYDNTSPDKAYTEPAYLISGSTAANPVILNVTIPFSELYESILSVDKDIMLNETLQVRFVWDSLSNIGFGATAITNPTGGAAALALPVSNNVNNMEIHLAIEKNIDVVNNLQQKISSSEGFSLMIPYCFYNQTLLTGTNQSVTLRINRQNGMTLERIYHSLFAPSAVYTAIYNNNQASTGLDHFYTNLNNNRLTQYDLYPSQLDDYKILRPILLNSTVQTPNIHYYNWCWVEEFGDGSFDYNPDNVVSGIDLNLGEQKWDFVAFLNPASNLTHQSTIVCKRKLVITGNGLVLI
ncbi:hypothetical protein DLAC_05879 [Tieghemostelium lacteum]|uniref:Uncharacterized protein n=1 Tax=Tieghemostelium lacteum TaxID=361077 RepID=A0A151ZGY8_TIELA|nr:hypothetical protein DLAC_05879 [Tieghemostelium lacteum]|eukprot:KYQ93233.1 hypothetical protein DLAC_05879 [Tieghemostelium lacteum]